MQRPVTAATTGTSSDGEIMRRLLRETRVLSLALLVEGAPDASLLPFAASADGRALLVLASALARHSKGLVAEAPFAALLHQSDGPEANPFALARLGIEGRVFPVPRDSAPFESLAAAYLARLPEGRMLFELGDFGLHALAIERGRLVAGFARARNVSAEDIAAAIARP